MLDFDLITKAKIEKEEQKVQDALKQNKQYTSIYANLPETNKKRILANENTFPSPWEIVKSILIRFGIPIDSNETYIIETGTKGLHYICYFKEENAKLRNQTHISQITQENISVDCRGPGGLEYGPGTQWKDRPQAYRVFQGTEATIPVIAAWKLGWITGVLKGWVKNIDLCEFLSGSIDLHTTSGIDSHNEFVIWRESMFMLKNFSYSQNEVLEAFSHIPGYDPTVSQQQIKTNWNKENDPKRVRYGLNKTQPYTPDSILNQLKSHNDITHTNELQTREEIKIIVEALDETTYKDEDIKPIITRIPHDNLALRKWAKSLLKSNLKIGYDAFDGYWKKYFLPEKDLNPSTFWPMYSFTPEELNAEIEGLADTPLKWLREKAQLVYVGDLDNINIRQLMHIGDLTGDTTQNILLGTHGSGKSKLQLIAARVLSDKYFINIMDLSEQSLKYLDEALDPTIKVLFIQELDALKGEAIYYLKMMSSDDGGGKTLNVEKGKEGTNELVWQSIRKMSIYTTYANREKIDVEVLSRLSANETDQTYEHNKAVREAICADSILQKEKEEKFDRAMAAFRTFIEPRVTEIPQEVYIPYSCVIPKLFEGNLEARANRDLKKFLKMIEFSTKFHALVKIDSRVIVSDKSHLYLVADPLDFALVYDLFYKIILSNINELTETDGLIITAMKDLCSLSEEKKTPNKNSSQSILFGDNNKYEGDSCEIGFNSVQIWKEVAKKKTISNKYCQTRVRVLGKLGYFIPEKVAKNGNVLSWKINSDTDITSICFESNFETIYPKIQERYKIFLESKKIDLPKVSEYCLTEDLPKVEGGR